MVQREPRERLLTKSEMCEALGIGETMLRRLVKAGRVRVVKLGHRTVRYAESEVARIAASARAER